MLLCLLNTVMNYISRICNEGERHPFNPCSFYQQSFSNTDYKDFHGCYCFEKNYPFNPSNPCSKHSPVNVKKDRQKKYQPCFVPFLTVISTFSAIFSKKYFLLNVIPPFHLTTIIILIIRGLYMVELRWN